MSYSFRALLAVLLLNSCVSLSPLREPMSQQIDLIPAPVSLEQRDGCFTISESSIISCTNPDGLPLTELLQEYLHLEHDIELQVVSHPAGETDVIGMLLEADSELQPEEYILIVSRRNVSLKAADPLGMARGVQTIRQLLLLSDSAELPCLEIRDYPRYNYRGMHLDVSRHFFPREFVLKYIDLMALYGYNTFHWHLVDDNGWRIEIKRYPGLTEVGAWRADRGGIHWTECDPRQPGEPTTYGGFYTQAEVREVVEYARRRQITVIPEIEMPGHTMAALAAYPEFSCTGGPFDVCTGSYWPITDIYCAGNDSTFTFLENILLEVIELFPGEYVHIGGDEADKKEWKRCPRCQSRIAAENLAGVDELQSWFIQRIEKFLLSHNRRLIGWDEILEGGLAPQATVMSWQGMQGGIDAARAGHDVIMTPMSHCYFDYYQADSEFEPEAIGGYLPLKRVYAFESTPAELDSNAAVHILGGQGNVWSEYMPDTHQVEYMILPRLCALAEALWSQPEHREWQSFQKRLQSHYQLFERKGLNYSRGSFRVGIEPLKTGNDLSLHLVTEQYEPEIRYTLDGSDPDCESSRYHLPLPVKGAMEIRAACFRDGALQGRVTRKRLTRHLASGRPVQYTTLYSGKYPGAGQLSLVDGLRGGLEFSDPAWQGFEQTGLEVTIDLGIMVHLERLQVGCLHDQRSWIFLPERVEVALSADGEIFSRPLEVTCEADPESEEPALVDLTVLLTGLEARFLKVTAINRGLCPEWHPGADGKAWIFIDEITVE
jgi:hexosaminidase